MQESQSKLMVALSLESEELKAPEEKMPLHVTVTPPFVIEQINMDAFQQYASRIASEIPHFSVVGKEEAYFGADASIRVRKVGSSTLIAVHEAFFNLAHQFDHNIDDTFAGKNYRAHSIYQGDKGLDEGEIKEITSLDIYEKIGKMWRVNHTVLFGHEQSPELTEIVVDDRKL